MDGFQRVWKFWIFRQTWQVRTCSFWTILEHVRYPAPINPMNVRTLSRCCLLILDGIFMVSKMFEFFRCFVKFDRFGTCNIFHFFYSQKQNRWFLKSLSFWIFGQIWLVWTCNYFFCFWTITEHLNHLSRLFPINQRQYQDLIKWWILATLGKIMVGFW